MNRRHFLSVLASVAAGAVLDPERLLWRPGARTYFDIHRPGLVWEAYDEVTRFVVSHVTSLGDVSPRAEFRPTPGSLGLIFVGPHSLPPRGLLRVDDERLRVGDVVSVHRLPADISDRRAEISVRRRRP